MAVEVLSYNVRAFPSSWNVYDSLGEAYMKRGDTRLAIEDYRASLKLNPDNDGASQALRTMEVTD
jgi:cytochrome c-type biogenesis protein CcmH/NrfG